MLQLEKLNLPAYEYRIAEKNNQVEIFCLIRKRFVLLTPEEWVRQHFINFLVSQHKYPKSMIQVEKEILYNRLRKRFDIVVYNPMGKALMLIECKASSVKLSENTFQQAAVYNLNLQSEFLVITNGMQHYCCRIDHKLKKYDFIQSLPEYPSI